MARHIFFDNSNTLGGAQAVCASEEEAVPWPLLRLDLPSLFKLVEGTGLVETRVFSASGFPASHSIWHFARMAGYDVCLLSRVEKSSGQHVEQAVDELLHLKMANAVLDYAAPQTMVIVSGDGNISDSGTSFVGQAERALKRGWYIDVCYWSPVVTSNYNVLSSKYPGKVNFYPLDTHYKEVTFVKSGFLSLERRDIIVPARHQIPLTDLAPVAG